MEPIPETIEAIEEYGPFEDVDFLADLRERARRVEQVAPDCVGLSLATRDHGVTFTLVASDLDVAVLDAVQYLSGGPCVSAVDKQQVTPSGFELAELLDEASW